MAKSSEKGNKDSCFQLQNSTDPDFSLRCKDAFACLDVLEKKHEAFEDSKSYSQQREQRLLMKTDPLDDNSFSASRRKRNPFPNRYNDKNDSSWNRGVSHHTTGRSNDRRCPGRRGDRRNRYEEFIRPRGKPPRRSHHSFPDHKKNPDKWTFYSLEDVESGEMSEKSNRRAAFDFLAERKKLQDESEEKFEVEGSACSKGVISFSRPKLSQSNNSKKSMTTNTNTRHVSDIIKEDILTTGDGNCHEDEDAKFSSDNSKSVTSHSKFKSRKTVRRSIRGPKTDDEDDGD